MKTDQEKLSNLKKQSGKMNKDLLICKTMSHSLTYVYLEIKKEERMGQMNI